MDSLTFQPGRAFLLSHSPTAPWSALFEDEGPAGYFYACDRSLLTDAAKAAGAAAASSDMEQTILDSMLIYNGAALADGERERLASVQWSRDGMQCVLYLDGTPQAFADFAARQSFCRSNFPNFLDAQGAAWKSSSHAWNDEAIKRFEADIYQ